MKKITTCIFILSFCFIVSMTTAGVKLYNTAEQYKHIPPNLDNYSAAEILFLAFERMRASTLTFDTWDYFPVKQQVFESKLKIIEVRTLHPDDFFYDKKIINLLKKLRNEDEALSTAYKSATFDNDTSLSLEMEVVKNTLIDIQEEIYRVQIFRFNETLNTIQENSKSTILMILLGIIFIITVFVLLLLQTLKLKQTLKEKNLFISTIYHEMSSSIQAILLASDLINLSVNDEKVKKTNNKINSHADKLLRQTRDILDYSIVEIGKANITKSECNPQELLNETLKSINTTNNIIKLHTTRLDQNIISDRMKLTSIMFNLIDNANKYTREGLITIHAKISRGYFLFRIADTGVGIDKNHLPHIFKPFNQGSNGKSKQGLGLGLTIVKMNLQLLNGKMKLKSTPQKGTRLILKIPVDVPIP